MFKNLFSQKQTHNPSTYTNTSPFKPNRTPVKIQRETLQRSPLRNRPSDIKNLKTYLNAIVPRNTSPLRLKSPIKIDTLYEIPFKTGRDVSPRRTTIKQETRYISPSRGTNRNMYQLPESRKGAETWRAPSEVIGNYPSTVGCKENSKLFTNLIKNIKSQGDDIQHTDQYNRRRIEVEATNAGMKKQASLFQQLNYNRVQSQIHFQTETKIRQTQTHIQIEQRSTVEVKDGQNLHHSFGIIPFIESITPSKHRGTCDQGVEVTLRPSIGESFRNKIVLEREYRNEMMESLSDNDRVIESANSSELELNMSLTK